jgi:hypothetical protein
MTLPPDQVCHCWAQASTAIAAQRAAQGSDMRPLFLCRIYVHNAAIKYGYARGSMDGRSVEAEVLARSPRDLLNTRAGVTESKAGSSGAVVLRARPDGPVMRLARRDPRRNRRS